MTTPLQFQPAPIRDGEAWPLRLFQQATGLSADALRRARRRGLRIVRIGRRKFVLAESWLEYLRTEQERQSEGPAPN